MLYLYNYYNMTWWCLIKFNGSEHEQHCICIIIMKKLVLKKTSRPYCHGATSL
jgi:hypothetical protein